jgi:hypothetical protein
VGAKLACTAGAVVFLLSAAFVSAQSGTDGGMKDSPNIRKVSISPNTSTSPDTQSPPDPAGVNDLTITHASGLTRPPTHGITAEVRAILARLSLVQRRKFERASADFPTFCQDWERKLHERELNNLAHINWQKRDGYETATYVAYGKVDACETKESAKGVPIGKLSYQEYNYYLAGKTVEEAKHATPKLVGRTNTLEIFSWDRNRWFY